MRIIPLLSVLLILGNSIRAQSLTPELIAAAGDCFVGSSASLCYTIGECITETTSASGGMLNQGFQQNFESIPWGMDDNTKQDIGVFPIPAENYILIRFPDDARDVTVSLFTSGGAKILQEELSTGDHALDLGSLAPGIYLLKIGDRSGKFFGTYKIVKF